MAITGETKTLLKNVPAIRMRRAIPYISISSKEGKNRIESVDLFESSAKIKTNQK